MKRIIALLLLSVMLLASLLLTSCSNPPELSEIKPTIETLIENSREVNKILFGEGLPIAMQTVDGVTEPVPSDYKNYDYVDPKTGFFMVEQIKEAAEKCFTKDYIEPLYENFFTGHYDQVYGSVVRANYIDSDNGLLKLKTFEAYIKGEMRSYDYSTIEIIKPSRADYVTFTIVSEKDGEKLTVRLAIAMTENGWRLDSPTY